MLGVSGDLSTALDELNAGITSAVGGSTRIINMSFGGNIHWTLDNAFGLSDFLGTLCSGLEQYGNMLSFASAGNDGEFLHLMSCNPITGNCWDTHQYLPCQASGDVVDEQSIFLSHLGSGGDRSQTESRVEFWWQPQSSGQFELAISGVDAGIAEVVAPPQVSIVEPTNQASDFFLVKGQSQNGQSWYVDVDLEASADDEIDGPLDGPLDGTSIEWSTVADENNDKSMVRRSLGTGAALTARLYTGDGSCGSITEHQIEVEATNSAEVMSSAQHRIVVLMGMC